MTGLVFTVLFCGYLIVSCGSPAPPPVDEADVYTERLDRHNNKQYERTRLVLNGEDWVALKGTFASHRDKDHYRIRIDPDVFNRGQDDQYVVATRVAAKGKIISGFLAAGYPAKAVSVDRRYKKKTHLLLGLGKIRLRKGVRYIVVNVFGRSTENKKSIYSDKNPYTVYLK
jgi:hypothetical protein